MSSYNKILNSITNCETKNKIIPFTKILEYAAKEKIIPKNSSKEIIPKDSKCKSFSNSNNNMKDMLKFHKKNSNETPKHKIRNLFLNSRNEDNKLFLSNKIYNNSKYQSNKYNTIEERQLSARKRHSKNIFSIPEDKVSLPELNLFKKKNELFETINENFNTIKLNDTNSIQTSSKRLSNYQINQKSTFQKSIDLNSLKLINNQNKKISNLKNLYYQTEMKNKIQNEKILMDNPNINTEGIINYTKRKANKTKTHKYFNNLTIIPKLKHKKKSGFNFRAQNQTQKDKTYNNDINISSDSGLLKRKKLLTKKYEIMLSPHKFHKRAKRNENLNKHNFQLNNKINAIKSKNNTNDGKSHTIKRPNSHTSCKNVKQSYKTKNKFILNLLNEYKKINNSGDENEKKSNTLENKKIDLKDFFKKEFFNLADKSLNTGKNIIIVREKKSSMDIKKILCNIYIDKDEEKYIMKNRMKIKDKVKQNNEASYLYKEYTKELKNSFLRNVVIDNMTKKMMKDYKKSKSKISIVFEKEKEINLYKLFNEMLDKCHKIYYSFEDIVKVGKSLIKYSKIENKIKIKSNHILEMFNIYQILLKQFENKWKVLKIKDIHYYEKMKGIFSSINKMDSNYDFYIYKYRIKNEIILSLDNISFNKKLSPNKLNNNNCNDIDNNINKTIKIKDNLAFRISSKKNNKLNIYNNFKNLNSGNKNRISFLFQKMGLFGLDNNCKIDKKNPDDADSVKLKKKESFNIFSKVYGMDEKNSNQLEKGKELNIAELSINNYNILKNKKLFDMNDNEEDKSKKKISKKNNFFDNLNKKFLESITFKYHDLDSMSKVASVIKTQEIQRDDPDIKLFYKIVDAFSNRRIKVFDYLIKNEEEAINRIINRQEISTGNTLLMYATINNLISIVEFLLKKGAEPDIQNNFGNSALHFAYRNDNFFIINLLIEYGAEQKIKNINGLYPWQMPKFINN